MKYLVILGDGMADYPVPELNGQTPLEVSHKPQMDFLAKHGTVGLARTVPTGMPPGSDVANLAVMGYNPQIYYTGRSPLEAVSIGVDLSPSDVAFRCNLVTLSEDADYSAKTMVDYSSDEISTEEAAVLIQDIGAQLGNDQIHFYPGISYRHLMVWHGGPTASRLTPPHDISDRPIHDHLPKGDGAAQLLEFMVQSADILKNHPVNLRRIQRGLRPATSIWLWGQGTKPNISSFHEKYQLHGSVISAVDLAKGLGICAGLNVIEVPGATGNVHTNYKGKAEAALAAFAAGQDFVYLHVEAPDEAGHRGEVENKVKAIEKIDGEILGPILERLPELTPDYKIMLLPDHPTPLSLKTHVADPVPFVIYQSTQTSPGHSTACFTEKSAAVTGLFIEEGFRLMDRFILG
ncbi:phosphoglycerate mutase [Hydrogenispora ethanolica]|uniref:Phosphoglycerate mutase n=1 Tax=Hydrogenispora ethanolica TaxID=1082276 RepID=A0A4R1RB08_HYDET|nr:cofactor-independent phosphoglycerate mutase [Hydrogenispora ethanolica]TCL62964.1 phosphoglycerate mutase [Hydrogenispora ethanolica]